MSTLYHFRVQMQNSVLAKRALSQNCRKMYLQIIVTLRYQVTNPTCYQYKSQTKEVP